MNENEEPAYTAILNEMFGALDKPLTQAKRDAMYNSFFNRLSVHQWSRIRDKLLKDLEAGKEIPRSFGPSNIWAIIQSLRSHAPARTTEEEWKGDEWDITANKRLLIYIRWRASRKLHYFLDDTTKHKELLEPLIGYKKAWAVDCREYEEEHGEPPPMTTQTSWFRSCMQRAEEQIKEIRELHKENIPCPM